MNLDVPYGISRRLVNVDMDSARKRVTEALKAEGFGVLTEIDIQTTLKNKLNLDRDPYVILGACNPQLADRALQIEPGIGLLLPCSVVVARDGSDTWISAMSPDAMFTVAGDRPELRVIAKEAGDRLQRAIDSA